MTSPEPVDLRQVTVGLLGGTGDQGRGLARRFALAGVRVLLGSRDADRAAAVAADLPDGVAGTDNATCAADASVVVVAVPWDGHAGLLSGLADQLAGRVVVDCVNPLGFDARGAYPVRVPEGSACEQAAALLPRSVVVGAFHHLSAVHLLDPRLDRLDGDVLVVGDDREATDLVEALVGLIPGLRGIYAGRLRNAGQVEALTANLIAINRRYKAHAGIKVTDV
jgi:8-hydroxy-5-deazaflavin:NADPH oxidoreductase